MDDIMKTLWWIAANGNGGTYTHAKTGAAMVVYVDDRMMCAAPKYITVFWSALEKSVDYKDPAAPMARYLGALYRFDALTKRSQTLPAIC